MSTAMVPKDAKIVNTITSAPEETALALIEHVPAVVLAEARLAAQALRDVIARKPRKIILNGRQYLEFEDWQLLGCFYGITASEESDPEFVQVGEAQGFKSTCVALDRTGRALSRATAYCLNDEPKWSTRPKYEWHYVLRNGGTSAEDPGPSEMVWVPNPKKQGKNMPERKRVLAGEEAVPMFQLASMAQTRANSKVLANVLRRVAVLADFATTPAEEIEAQADVIETTAEVVEETGMPRPTQGKATDNADFAGGQPQPLPIKRNRQPGDDDVQHAAPESTHQGPSKPPSAAIPDCPKCGTGRTVIRSKYNGPAYFCFPAKGGCGGKFNDATDFEAAK